MHTLYYTAILLGKDSVSQGENSTLPLHTSSLTPLMILSRPSQTEEGTEVKEENRNGGKYILWMVMGALCRCPVSKQCKKTSTETLFASSTNRTLRVRTLLPFTSALRCQYPTEYWRCTIHGIDLILFKLGMHWIQTCQICQELDLWSQIRLESYSSY